MKNIKGFTLVEILTTVLIIGVLVAITLPQYKKAVFKSRATAIVNWFNSMEKTAQLYQMTYSLPKPGYDITLFHSGDGVNLLGADNLSCPMQDLKDSNTNCSVLCNRESCEFAVLGDSIKRYRGFHKDQESGKYGFTTCYYGDGCPLTEQQCEILKSFIPDTIVRFGHCDDTHVEHVCPNGSSWNGVQCVFNGRPPVNPPCPSGSWNGTECI